MRDSDIRASLHRKTLRRYHRASETLVIDELGLKHGSCRADIAIVNGRLVGYEIKSDKDSLSRLKSQIAVYDAIFDSITIVVGPRHRSLICRRVPRHWGVVVAAVGRRGGIYFETKRRARANPRVDLLAVTQLLWRSEALEMVRYMKTGPESSRFGRKQLYKFLVKNVPAAKLRQEVRICLRKRSNWRGRKRPSRYDDLSQRDATLANSPAECGPVRTC